MQYHWVDKSILVDQARITASVAPKSYRSPTNAYIYDILSVPVQRICRDREKKLT